MPAPPIAARAVKAPLRFSVGHADSDEDLLDLVEAELVAGSVVELRGPGRFVAGDHLHVLQESLVLKVDGDARRPEAVAANRR